MEPWLGAYLPNGNGDQLACGQYVDNYYEGYAQVVLTYQGTPGNIYFATGQHLAFVILSRDQDMQQPTNSYDDFYNFQAVSQLAERMYGYYLEPFYQTGPGPDTSTRASTIEIADTFNSKVLPVPLAGLVSVNFSGPLDQDNPKYSAYVHEMATSTIGQLVGTDGYGNEVCYNGNQETGKITNGDTIGPYTIKRFLIGKKCFLGTKASDCSGAAAFPADDTGDAAYHSDTPSNGRVFNLDWRA